MHLPPRVVRVLVGVLVVVAALAAATAPALALAIPAPPARFLYDGAGLLQSAERQQIEERLMALDAAGVQVGVAVLRSLEGEPLEDVSLRIAEAWKPGRKGQDDGALVVFAIAERKVRIEVGYGLEGRLPDGAAGRIIRGVIAPEFRERRYAAGILGAVEAIGAAANGQPIPDRSRGIQRGVRRGSSVAPFLVFALIGLFLFVTSLFGRARGLDGRRRPSGALPLLLWMIANSSSHRGGHGGWGGGGSFGGGGGSFGGGSFGGGGASGGW